MKQLKEIKNYLVFHNGTIECHPENVGIAINDGKIDVKDAASLQIIYLIDQEGKYCFDLKIKGQLELIETYDFKVPASLVKNIEVLQNSNILRYNDNQSSVNGTVEVTENVSVERDSNVRCAYVELSDSSIEMNVNHALNGSNANSTVRLASLAKGQEKKHMTFSLTHFAPHTTGIMDNYGVVKDASNLVIDGIGTIKQGNHQSSSHQTNKIIVFDEKCNAKANPYLYIDEYDVKASHGASVGKIDEDHLYYLQSRGLSKKDAMHLVTYGYFIPVYQNGTTDQVIGMVFVGTNKARKDAIVNKILGSIMMALLVVMLLCIVTAMRMAASISKNIKNSVAVVGKLADGDLNVWVDEKLLKRKDEIGDLSRGTMTLRDAMKSVIRDISENAKQLLSTSQILGTAADNTNGTMSQVQQAVSLVVDNSSEQAKNSRNTSDHMKIMGENITETTAEVQNLDQNATFMHSSSENASATLEKLCGINEQVEQMLAQVQQQTDRTNDSVQKIQQATTIISSIAEETNLLSLNASIEAARAGESGRGFAVVAGQIKKLAEQSDQSSQEIEQIASTLIRDSSLAVESMQSMQQIITSQSESMAETQNIVKEVLGNTEICH